VSVDSVEARSVGRDRAEADEAVGSDQHRAAPRHSGAGRVEPGRAGVDDLDEAVPAGSEAGQVRRSGSKLEQVPASAMRSG
jgi:hypothetical protein